MVYLESNLDEIFLHIRKNGDWTGKLYTFFADNSKLGYYLPLVEPKKTWKKFFLRIKETERE